MGAKTLNSTHNFQQVAQFKFKFYFIAASSCVAYIMDEICFMLIGTGNIYCQQLLNFRNGVVDYCPSGMVELNTLTGLEVEKILILLLENNL